MKNIIEYSVKHPVSVMMYFLLVFAAGLLSALTIKMDYLPFISDRTLLVSTSYNGIPSSQMKELVTIPVEDAFSSIKGIKNMSSLTRDGLSFVKIELQYKTNINASLIESRQIIDRLSQILPQDCSKPEVDIFGGQKKHLLKIAVIPKNKDLCTARYESEKEIKQFLQKINGVGKISVKGGLKEQLDIILNPELVISRNLSLEQIQNAIMSSNYEYPAGTISDLKNEYILKTSGLYKTIEEIYETPIHTENGIILLKEIAEIKPSFDDKESFSFFNSEECIEISVDKKTEFSPITVSKNIRSELENIKMLYPQFDFHIISDISKQIKNSIFLVYISAIISSLITFLILFVFLRSIKISLIVSLTIPLCILFSITVLSLAGKTINLFSLSGISISIGMIVDTSIIVIENVLKSPKKTADKSIIFGALNVQKSNISSCMTTIIVFIPFFLLPGIFGELFCDLSLAIMASISCSLLISFTFIPACIKLFLKPGDYKNVSIPFLHKAELYYKNFLFRHMSDIKLKNKIIFLSFLCSIIIFPLLKKEIIQNYEDKKIEFTIIYPQNYSIEHTQSCTKEFINRVLESIQHITITSDGGIESTDFESLADISRSKNNVACCITYKTRSQKQKIREVLKSSGLKYSLLQSKDITSDALDITDTYIICAASEQELENKTHDFPSCIPDEYQNEHIFIPDPIKCNFYKIPRYYISSTLYQMLEGLNAGDFLQNGKYIPLKIKYPEGKLDERKLYIQYKNTTIPIKSLGKFSTEYNRKSLFRYNKLDAKEIILSDKNIKSRLPKNTISTSYEQKKELFKTSLVLIIITLLLLYCLLGSQFESFLMPLIFLLTVIPSFAGALIFLFIFNQTLNINGILALIILFGTSLNNSIILYESINFNQASRSISPDCFVSRLRPIAITTLTSVCALIPFTISFSGINTQTSMAIALTGGLIVSLPAILIIYPIIFTSVFKRSSK